MSYGFADNFLALLGISGARILVVGNFLENWRRLFPDSMLLENLSNVNFNNGCYDLILYHSRSAGCLSRLLADLKILKKLAGEHGWILYFGENFFSIPSLKKLLKYRDFSLLRNLYRMPLYFRKLFALNSMPVVKEFIGLPENEAAEELVVPGSKFLEVPQHAHLLYRLAVSLKKHHLLSNGLIHIISDSSFENGYVITKVTKHIQNFLGNPECLCIVERLDIRLRGSLIIFVTEENTRKNFIARLVSAPQARKIVSRNQSFLNMLHTSKKLADTIKIKLPKPIGEMDFAGFSLFTETLVKGKLAWKVNQRPLRKIILDDAFDFIIKFQLSMSQSVLISDDHARKLFHEDAIKICDHQACNPELASGVCSVVQKICRAITGNTLFLTVSHGDYGYGNILVHPATGRISGVIDWDTGREEDLPGIDYLNLVVQKKRSELGYSVAQAFTEATEEVLRNGAIDDKNFYASAFDITGGRLKIILYACLIRYMSRAAQYPEIFNSEQDDYLVCLNYLVKLAPL